jgi:hypothetical protein
MTMISPSKMLMLKKNKGTAKSTNVSAKTASGFLKRFFIIGQN